MLSTTLERGTMLIKTFTKTAPKSEEMVNSREEFMSLGYIAPPRLEKTIYLEAAGDTLRQ